MGLICINPPLVEPVAMSELKEMLRLDQSDTSQDVTLRSLGMAARAWCETITQRRFVQQTWRLYMDFFPGYIDMRLAGQKVSSPFVSGSNAVLVGIRYAIVLPFPPVQSLIDFSYLNANGATTSMTVGPLSISAVSNISGQPIQISTTLPHGLQSSSPIVIAGNSALLAVLNGQANQVITVNGTNSFTLFALGTGSTITATGTVTGSNFIQDLESQPARLTPIFGQMWPVARVVANAVVVDYVLGYATPMIVTATVNNAVLGGGTFIAANVGQPISIPGAADDSFGVLNTIIASVDGGGNATLRDTPAYTATDTTALLVNYGTPAHWELIKTGIKFLVNLWFVNRMPSFDAKTRDCVRAILSPASDRRL